MAKPNSPSRDSHLLEQVSRSVFWNATLLPVASLLNAAFSVILRRGFGLESGIYDILLGVLNSVIFYSSLGIPMSLQKLVSELDASGDRRRLVALLWKAALARLGALVAWLVPLNLFAAPLAEWLALGPDGARLLHILSVLIFARAVLDLAVKSLQASLRQLAVNLLMVAQTAIETAMIALCLALGFGIGGVIGSLSIAAFGLTIVGGLLLKRQLEPATPSTPAAGAHELDPEVSSAPLSAAEDVEPPPLGKFAALTYFLELSTYFASPSFAKPMLGAMLGDYKAIAIFSTGYYVAFTTVTIVVSAFRGIYRPMFARLSAAKDTTQLRAAFSAVSKAQVAMLAPIGVGLGVMVGDYLPLLYGEEFAAAVTIARWFILLLFAECAFNLGLILLWTNERFRLVLGAQAVLLAGVPLFLWAAARGSLVGAVILIGAARVASALVAYAAARRSYGVQFPWEFSARVGVVCLAMGAVLVAGRSLLDTSWPEAISLTVIGAVVFVVGIRVARVIGGEETALLRRANIPGGRWLLAWVAPD